MYSGAQISLYPMADDFVPIILSSVKALDKHRDHLKITTDDLSTLLVGRPESLFLAMHDLFVASASSGKHVVIHATISRGCPGEPDAEICQPRQALGTQGDLPKVIKEAQDVVDSTPVTGQEVAAQFSYYPLGQNPEYMKEIYAAIDFIKQSGVFGKAKNFCTRLDGDAGKVFATLGQVFLKFAPEEAHITLDLTVSANSPSKKE